MALRKTILITFLFVVSLGVSLANVITLQGYNQGKNLKVQNTSGSLNNFCTIAVYINGKKVMDGLNQPIYEIDLSSYDMGERIIVKIQHKEGCAPRVLNRQAIKPNSRFTFGKITVQEEGLKWITKGEEKQGKLVLQQLTRFPDGNKWEPIGELPTKGNLSYNEYYLKVRHYCNLNKYRVKYEEVETGLTFYSDVASYTSTKKDVTLYPKRVVDKIYFTTSSPIPYRIYDSKGSLVLSGKGIYVNATGLLANQYYTVIYDNRIEKVLKKKNK